ncbi:MAG TPA: site-2 protease family protein [Saprospiraceae bacterium]|nr:site-2 protease family protein [Saprospiraceae bacterium]
MQGSYHIATISGIPVKVHWSFGLLLLWVVFETSKGGFQPILLLLSLAIVLSVFFCVILHEFGHALAARKFGVKTFDIIMTPIGGIARLERMPDGKGQEFWVAIAGPVVNFLIVGLIWISYAVFKGEVLPLFSSSFWNFEQEATSYFKIILLANGYLGAFNLLPAFPMDGGRILRSLLSLRMDRNKATQIASFAGQVIALIMFGYGIMQDRPTLILIGVFIFFAARQENKALQRQTWLTKTKASDLMEPIEYILELGQSMSEAKQRIKNLKGDSFIVWAGPQIPVGYLTKEFISNFDLARYPGSLTDAWVIPSPAVVPPETPASQLFAFMQHHKIPLTLVSDDHQFQGVVHWKKLSDGA